MTAVFGNEIFVGLIKDNFNNRRVSCVYETENLYNGRWLWHLCLHDIVC